MSSEDGGGSITLLLSELKAGDPDALQALWSRYFQRLVELARGKLRNGRAGGISDEEDIALQVFERFRLGFLRGRFPQLDDRNDLWRLLVVLTARAVTDERIREHRQKRGEGRVIEVSTLAASPETADLLQFVAANEPTPEFALMMAEEVRRLLDLLGEDDLRQIALAKFEGDTNKEIAAKLSCSLRTVANKLKLIRLMWNLR